MHSNTEKITGTIYMRKFAYLESYKRNYTNQFVEQRFFKNIKSLGGFILLAYLACQYHKRFQWNFICQRFP